MKKKIPFLLVLASSSLLFSCANDATSSLESEETPSSSSSSSSSKSSTSNSSSSGGGSSSITPSVDPDAPVVHTITFNTMGGSAIEPIKVEHGKKATEPTAPTKDGYTFGGWYLTEAFETSFSFETVIECDYTLFAKWNSEGGAGTEDDTGGGSEGDTTETVYYIVGSFTGNTWSKEGAIALEPNPNGPTDLGMKLNVEIPASGEFKITDFTDEGWYGYHSGLTDIATEGNNGNIVVKEAGTYDIYFNANKEVWMSKKTTITEDTKFYITGNFTNWELNADYLMDRDSSGDNLALKKGVHFDKDAEFKITDGDQKNWYGYRTDLSSSFTSGVVDGNITITVAGTYDVYLNKNEQIWVDQVNADQTVTYHTVSFDTNGGSEIASIQVEDGKKVSQPADPTKDNYTFDGWYTSSTYETTFDFDAAITGDCTAYAKWTAKSASEEGGETGGDSGGDSGETGGETGGGSGESTGGDSSETGGETGGGSDEQTGGETGEETGGDSKEDETSSAYYIVGSFTAETPNWDKATAKAMTASEDGKNIAYLEGVEIPAYGKFKVTNFVEGESWYGYHDGLSDYAEKDDDGNIVVKDKGIYDIYFNAKKEVWLAKRTAVAEDTKFYITGGFTEWKDNDEYLMERPESGDNVAVKTNVHFDKDAEFKVKGIDWYGYHSGLASTAYVTKSGDSNLKITVAGTYNVYLNKYSQVWIDQVSVDEQTTEVVYYIAGTFNNNEATDWKVDSAIKMEKNPNNDEDLAIALGVELTADVKIKVTDFTDDGWYGYHDGLKDVATGEDGKDITIKETGKYDITLNKDYQVWITKSATTSGDETVDTNPEESTGSDTGSEGTTEGGTTTGGSTTEGGTTTEGETTGGTTAEGTDTDAGSGETGTDKTDTDKTDTEGDKTGTDTDTQTETETEETKTEEKTESGDQSTKSGGTSSEVETETEVVDEKAAAIAKICGPENSTKTDWYLVGAGSLWTDDGWQVANGIQLFTNPANTNNTCCALNVTFAAGDQFKIRDTGSAWHGYDKVDTYDADNNMGTKKFEGADDGNGGQNFKCKEGGIYNIYVNNDNGTVKVWIEASK